MSFTQEAEQKLASTSGDERETLIANLRQRKKHIDAIFTATVKNIEAREKKNGKNIGVSTITKNFLVTYEEKAGFRIAFTTDLDVADFSGDLQPSEIKAIAKESRKELKRSVATLKKNEY